MSNYRKLYFFDIFLTILPFLYLLAGYFYVVFYGEKSLVVELFWIKVAVFNSIILEFALIHLFKVLLFDVAVYFYFKKRFLKIKKFPYEKKMGFQEGVYIFMVILLVLYFMQ